MVAWKSWTWTRSEATVAPVSSVEPWEMPPLTPPPASHEEKQAL